MNFIKVGVMSLGLLSGCVLSAAPQLIPEPQKMIEKEGQFELTPECRIEMSGDPAVLNGLDGYLREKLSVPTGFTFDREESGCPFSWIWRTDPVIALSLNTAQDSELQKEGYTLSVTPERVQITANSRAGLFYGIQSLLQLLPPEIESRAIVEMDWSVPCVEIKDTPRFEWRGLMLDVSRHFMTKEDVKSFIDHLARYKMNIFHWHLTDDQGWRIEIKSYPKLIEIGSKRTPRTGIIWNVDRPEAGEPATDSGFYTQDDIREVLAYAAERCVTVIPEIDAPGHFLSVLASYPEFACTPGPFYVGNRSRFYGEVQNTACIGNESVYQFMDSVLGEVAALFPAEYIHIGGDEAIKKYWVNCPKCQAVAKKEGFSGGEKMQSYFIHRMEKIIEKKGKKMIGWNEILEGGLPPNAAVMSWTGIGGGIQAAKEGHKVVMSPMPYYYLDLYQGEEIAEPNTYNMARLKTTYDFEPKVKEIPEELLMGIQGNVWAESVPHIRHAQYMTWPRGFAIAETAWSAPEKKSWETFIPRVETQFKRFDYADINYARSMYDPYFKAERDQNRNLVVKLETEIPGLTVHYTFDNTFPDHHSPIYTKPLSVPRNAAVIFVRTYRDGRPVGKQISMPISELEKRAGKK